MSNTGQKGITYLPGQGVYKVTVGWKGKIVTRYVRGEYPGHLKAAIRVRNQIEKKLGKPRTESVLRASGTTPSGGWKRRGKQVVRARTRNRKRKR